MKQTRILMGMPVTVEVVDPGVTAQVLDAVYAYFEYIDEKFSTYKDTSEISKINRHELAVEDSSEDMCTIFALSEQTRLETDGYFDIQHDGKYDPSGLVKGWAIFQAAELLRAKGFQHYYVEAGGDIQLAGSNAQGLLWRVGIRNPFDIREIVKVLSASDCGIATSGTYVRGQHIYNPKKAGALELDILSLTVIAADIYEADRFATAAFAMGKKGLDFIARLDGFEGYSIDKDRRATFTPGFGRYVAND